MVPGLFSINEIDLHWTWIVTIGGFSDWSRERENQKIKGQGLELIVCD